MYVFESRKVSKYRYSFSSFFTSPCPARPTMSRARIFGRVMGGKIDSWHWVGTKYGIESAMSHDDYFEAGIVAVLGLSLPTSHHFTKINSTPRRNFLSQGIDYLELMPGVLKSLKIRAQLCTPLILVYVHPFLTRLTARVYSLTLLQGRFVQSTF